MKIQLSKKMGLLIRIQALLNLHQVLDGISQKMIWKNQASKVAHMQ